MAEQFDVLVLGAGPAGGAAASKLAQAGKRVAMTDSDGYGGTCPLRGCEPKKVLHDVAEAAHLSELAEGMGIEQAPSINWEDLQMFKKSFVDPVPSAAKAAYAERGINTLQGAARFVDPDTVEIAGQQYEADHFVIATGARPASLDIEGEELLHISDDFLDLAELPESMTFVGGGYISFEFAFIAAQAGVRVTVIHRSGRPLKMFEPELADMVVAAARDAGITVHLGCPVTAVRKEDDGRFGIHVGEDKRHIYSCPMVFHGAGRTPNLDGLNLEAAGVRADKKGVLVDENYRSVSNPKVFAAGDCAATKFQLTPVADYEGKALADVILGRSFAPLDYATVPSVTFAMPHLGSVGLTQAQAKEQGLDVTVKSGSMAGFSSVQRMGYTHAGYKILICPKTDKIVGAHVFCPHAEEVVNLFALAMWTGTTAAMLKTAPWAYPSFCYEIRHML